MQVIVTATVVGPKKLQKYNGLDVTRRLCCNKLLIAQNSIAAA